ncbi:SDR family oxidoreductase [Nonomuraea sp. NPDC050328]|uniref:SDR family oxidoreductase n=1 Tax=Nonomuraea sp. NPDC050328 TaxID=3364361 RepID=UPI003788857B
MILVTGATGNVGRHVVTQLAEAGVPVRALVRDPSRTAFPAGVEVVRGDLTDPASLEPALDGVEDVFLVWPGFAAETAAAVVDVIKRRARRVVYLSANVVPGSTMFHVTVEQLIRDSGLAWTFLRPGGFATNTLGWIDEVRGSGVVSWVYGEAARSLIHEADIAAVATHVLVSAGHARQAYVLTGPEAITQAEQVRIIGEELGVEARWEELDPAAGFAVAKGIFGTDEGAREAMEGWGSFVASPEVVTDTVSRLLGRAPLSYRQWVRDRLAM